MKTLKVILSIFFLTISFNLFSQISIYNIPELEKIKGGTTYVVMNDPSAESSKEYIELFQKHWTYSEVAFITDAEVNKYLSPQNAFLTLDGFVTKEMKQMRRTMEQLNGVSPRSPTISLLLWKANDKYLQSNKKNKKLDDENKTWLASVNLYVEYKSIFNGDSIYRADYGANGRIRNWGPGILGNYIQVLMSYINKKQERSLYEKDFVNAKELKALKKEVLYVPDYVLIKFNNFTGDESKRHNEKEIFEDYKYKYKLISLDDLNTKILTEKNSFFYVIYLRTGTDKFITIFNSITGEIIYNKYYGVSYNIKSKDFEDISENIK